MTEEIKEIDFRGWWIVFDRDEKPVCAYPFKQDIPINFQFYDIRQIKEQVPFTKGRFVKVTFPDGSDLLETYNQDVCKVEVLTQEQAELRRRGRNSD